MNLSPTFTDTIQAVHGETGAAWLAQLPTQIEALSKRWNFRFIQPIVDLSYSFVGIVELNTAVTAILKLIPDHTRMLTELHSLQCFSKGVPKIYAFDEENNMLLLEHIKPGDPLKTLVQVEQDETATRIICQAILTLQSEQKILYPFPHLSELIKDLAALKGHTDSYLLSKAESLFHDLTFDRSQDVLLHGDLHHDNLIKNGTSWKAIDPHGYIGDRVAEVGAMIRNPMDCFPQEHSRTKITERRLEILAEELPFDPQRIKAWAFCMTILSAAWNIQDFGHLAKNEIELASLIDQTKCCNTR